MDAKAFEKQLDEKEKYFETIKTELNATAGQIILLKQLIEKENEPKKDKKE